MSALANLPEIVGFFSYARKDDDELYSARISALYSAIQHDLAALLGFGYPKFRLWRDTEDIQTGGNWQEEIKEAVGKSIFFIPIVTSEALDSGYCRFEYRTFLDRESELGRHDLVFPIIYASMPELQNEARWRADSNLFPIAERQFVDWNEFQRSDIHAEPLRTHIMNFCKAIVAALHRPRQVPEVPSASSMSHTGLRIVGKDELLRWGWNLRDRTLAKKLLTLDKTWIREDRPEFQGAKNSGTVSQWMNVFRKRPENWRLLVDGNQEIIGYWEIHVLFDEYYQQVTSGVLEEDKLAPNMMPPENAAGEYPAYFSMIGYDVDYRTVVANPVEILIWSIFNVFHSRAKNGQFITEMAARAWSADGGALCRNLGMNRLLESDKSPNIKVEHWSGAIGCILEHMLKRHSIKHDELIKLYHRKGLLKNWNSNLNKPKKRRARSDDPGSLSSHRSH